MSIEKNITNCYVNSLRLRSATNWKTNNWQWIYNLQNGRWEKAIWRIYCSFCIENCEIRILDAISPTLLGKHHTYRNDIILSRSENALRLYAIRTKTTLWRRTRRLCLSEMQNDFFALILLLIISMVYRIMLAIVVKICQLAYCCPVCARRTVKEWYVVRGGTLSLLLHRYKAFSCRLKPFPLR